MKTTKSHNAPLTGEIDTFIDTLVLFGGDYVSRKEMVKIMDKFIKEMKKAKRKHRKSNPPRK